MLITNLPTYAFYSDLYHNQTMTPQEKIAYLLSLKRPYPTKNHQTKPMQQLSHWLSASHNRHIILYDDPRYPSALKQISVPPLILFCHGKLKQLAQPGIAIVGSRHATTYGLRIAHMFAAALGQLDMTVISGLAQGIDTAAAQGALNTPGKTIAVLGNSTDVYYPPANHSLQEQIAQDGLVISEFWPGTRPHASQFPQRNRIISALGIATCVIEAGYPSGSLITARYALEQNKAVLATPGSIFQRTQAGTHWLIQQGADLLQHPNDVLRVIAPYTRPDPTSIGQTIMWQLLKKPTHLYALQRLLSLPQPVIQTQLLRLKRHHLITYHQHRYHCNFRYK